MGSQAGMTAASGNMLSASASLSTGISAYGNAYAQSSAQQTQAEYQRQQYETNARLAEMSSKDAIKRGDEDAAKYKSKIKQTIGAQRAAMAAQGIEVDSGSALEIQEDTAAIGAEDMVTIKNNAWREAWGYRVQANNSYGEGAMAYMAGMNKSRNTLITGGIQAMQGGIQGAGYGIRAVRDYQSASGKDKKD